MYKLVLTRDLLDIHAVVGFKFLSAGSITEVIPLAGSALTGGRVETAMLAGLLI